VMLEGMFELLWTEFQEKILKTYQTKYVQYLIFYVCGKEHGSRLTHEFLTRLLQCAITDTHSIVIRQPAICYIASFIARAQYVDVEVLRYALTHMCEWVHGYVLRTVADKLEASHHTVLHCVCQAVFYVFCFRLEDLLELGDGIIYLQSLKLDAIVKCRYLPLQVCAKHVAKEFARVMKKHEILYCAQFVRRRSVIAFPKIAYVSASDLTTSTQPLADFFPFDPYNLHRSKSFVEAMYRPWRGSSKDGNDSGSDSELSETDDDDFLSSSASMASSYNNSQVGSMGRQMRNRAGVGVGIGSSGRDHGSRMRT